MNRGRVRTGTEGQIFTRARPGLQREIEVADRQIDQLVYELYGLTEEEIRMVEESARSDGGIHYGA